MSCIVVQCKIFIIILILEHVLQRPAMLTSSDPTTIQETGQVFTGIVGSGSIRVAEGLGFVIAFTFL